MMRYFERNGVLNGATRCRARAGRKGRPHGSRANRAGNRCAVNGSVVNAAAIGVAVLVLASIGGAGITTTSSRLLRGGRAIAGSYSGTHPLKVCFISNGAKDDHNFNQQGYENSLSIAREFGGVVETSYTDNVALGPSSRTVAQDLVNSGCKVIFANSAGYETFIGPIAMKNPAVRFEEFSGSFPGAKNFGYYNINVLDSSYVGGIMAEEAAKTPVIGMVNAFPIPSIVAEVNGVELGAQSVRPDATERVIYISSFYNPTAEQQAAQALVAQHVGALVAGLNDAVTCTVAEKARIPCVGDTILGGAKFAPGVYLASYMYNWTPIFSLVIRDVLSGHPVPKNIIMGWPQGATKMSAVGPAYSRLVSAAGRAKVASVESLLTSGKLTVFKGPIKDQKGRLRIPAGQSYSTAQILQVSWMVKGVISSTVG